MKVSCHVCHRDLQVAEERCYHCGKGYGVQYMGGVDHFKMLGKMLGEDLLVTRVISSDSEKMVYGSLQVRLDRSVCLVVFSRKDSGDSAIRSKIEEACYRYASLNNPHLVRYFNVFFENRGGHLVVVTEYISGASLPMILAGGLDVETFLHVIHQVLRALSVAHKGGVVHPCFSLDSVILTSVGGDSHFVKLTGFTTSRELFHGDFMLDPYENVKALGQGILLILKSKRLISGLSTEVSGLLDQFFTMNGDRKYESATECLQGFERLFQVAVQSVSEPLARQKAVRESLPSTREGSGVLKTILWMHMPANEQMYFGSEI